MSDSFQGETMAKKKYYSNKMAGSGIAGMPQNVIYKEYPKVYPEGYEGLDDTMGMIDQEMKANMKYQKRGKNISKF